MNAFLKSFFLIMLFASCSLNKFNRNINYTTKNSRVEFSSSDSCIYKLLDSTYLSYVVYKMPILIYSIANPNINIIEYYSNNFCFLGDKNEYGKIGKWKGFLGGIKVIEIDFISPCKPFRVMYFDKNGKLVKRILFSI